MISYQVTKIEFPPIILATTSCRVFRMTLRFVSQIVQILHRQSPLARGRY